MAGKPITHRAQLVTLITELAVAVNKISMLETALRDLSVASQNSLHDHAIDDNKRFEDMNESIDKLSERVWNLVVEVKKHAIRLSIYLLVGTAVVGFLANLGFFYLTKGR